MHDHRGQGRFVVENSLIPLLPNLPGNKHDGCPKALGEEMGALAMAYQ
jgi:hypothetical protein